MSRTLFSDGDQQWTTFLALCNTIKDDTRLSSSTRAQLQADYTVASDAAATSGMPPDIRERFLAAINEVIGLRKQA